MCVTAAEAGESKTSLDLFVFLWCFVAGLESRNVCSNFVFLYPHRFEVQVKPENASNNLLLSNGPCLSLTKAHQSRWFLCV